MFGLGHMEIIIVILMSGGFGVPMSGPPAPEDPLLANVAPDQCLYYTTWAGTAEPDPDAATPSERLLAEPEVRQFVKYLRTQLQQMPEQLGRGQVNEAQMAVSQATSLLMETLLTRPVAIYVSELQVRQDGVETEAAAIVNLGPMKGKVVGALNQLRREVLHNRVRDTSIAGADFQQLQFDAQFPLLTWGIFRDDYLVVGLGQGAVEALLEQADTDAPQWLRDAQKRLQIERRSTLTYADLRGLLDSVRPLVEAPQGMDAIEATGLNQLQTYVSGSGLNESGFASRTLVDVEKPMKGILSLLAGPGMDAEDLSRIPADATVAAALVLDPQQALNRLLSVIETIDPRQAAQLEQSMGMLERNLGVQLRNDVLNGLGDFWQIYTSPSSGGLLTGWTATVSVKDPARFKPAHDQLVNIYRGMVLQNRHQPQVRSMQFAGQTVYTLSVPDGFPLAPSWCVTDEQLIVGVFPQAVKAHLSRDPGGQSLADVSMVAETLEDEGSITLLVYQDTRALFEFFYPILQLSAQAAASQLQESGIVLDVSQLPSMSSVSQHLQPSLFAVRQSPQGLAFESQQTLGGGNIGATAPLMTALLLPAVQSSRQAARRMQSSNNLKQIALAMHNFHDTQNGFPAAYNTDKEGKPLLSWRVHILPYIEQAALYDQFRFDEPWDSEHNRKLIPLMPELYKAPGSGSDPGKTNYLGIAGESGIFVPPPEEQQGVEHPTSISFRDITDGTSNTIAAVEARDELAVIWTKPDDFQPGDDPLRGLVGVRPDGFLAMFCDGSVRFIAENVDRNVLRSLFTRDGGEVVPNF